jgi:hypothetical protein
LSLDLEDVERQEDDLTDTDQRTRRRIENGFSRAFAERLVEVGGIVLCEVVSDEGLPAVLVYSL